MWLRSLWSDGLSEGRSVALDAEGNIYIAGYFGHLQVPNPFTFHLSESDSLSGIGATIFLAKFSPEGELIWARAAGGDESDAASSVAVADDGSVWLGGVFTGTASFGDTLTVEGGSHEGFLARYSADGQVEMARALTGGSSFEFRDDNIISPRIKLSETDQSVYFAGAIGHGFTDDQGEYNAGHGYFDAFLAKFNFEGEIQWWKLMGGRDWDAAFGLATDSKGNVVVVGVREDELVVDGDTVIRREDVFPADSYPFTAKFDPMGNLLWVSGPGPVASYVLARLNAAQKCCYRRGRQYICCGFL